MNGNDTNGTERDNTFCEMCETSHPPEELTSKGGIISVCDDCIDEDGNVVDRSQDTGNDTDDTYRFCPHCESTDIYNETGHGDTICRDCGWYTEQGSPNEDVSWRAVHTGNDQKEGEL